MRKVLVLLTGLLASAAAFATPLSGTYTINNSQVASASNFRNFVSAVAYLTGVGSRTDGGPANSAPFGVSGPVVFQVNAGTYTENISIGAVAGSSSSNTITFQSASGTASGTSLVSPGTPAAFIVTLNGTSYISFRNLTFLGASSNNFRGALSLTSCRSFAASGCAFTVPNNSSSGTAYIGTTSSRGLTIENSSFSGFLRHINSLSDSGVLIRNNTFTGNGSSNDNIHTEGMSSGRISANVFTSTNANAVYVGNAPTFIDTIWITGNRFISHRGQWSVTIQNEYAPADKPVIVANNFFGDVAREPVYLYYTSNIQLLHNSFYAPAANANVRLITFIESSQATVRNNIFQLKGNAAGSGAQIYYFPYSFPIVTPLNNVYYSLDTAQYADLRNRDAGARFEEVGFTSANDLHIINGCLQAPTIAWIADDIDGDARGAVNANYGADEVTGVANDAGFLRVTAPAPQVVSAGTVLQFAAKVRNYGTSTISSLQAGYQVNGGATVTETFNGISIAPCDSALITFTTTHTVNSEVTAVQVFPMLTNGAAETRTAIDTASATYYTAMSGTYTINAAGSGTRNFRRFAEADSALISRGVSAAVQFDMYPGNYAGDTLRSVAGLSAANPVLFRSYTGDTASVVFNARAVVVAEGAGFYTFRGLKFAILSSTNNLLLQRNTHDITIENCSFVTTAYPVCGFGCSAEPSWAINVINADSAIVIRNNKVVGMVNVTAGREQNGRVAVNTRGVLIKGNRIGAGRGFIYTSYTLYSIKADSLVAPVVDSNFVQNDLIYVKASGAFRVTRNRQYDMTTQGFTLYIGFIGNLYAYGNNAALSVYSYGGGPSRGLVANNMIHIRETGGNGLLVAGDNIDVVYNSINDRSDVNTSSSSIYNTMGPSVAASVSGNGTIFKNNIVSGIHTAGTAFKGQVISSNLPPASIDYNGYYTTEATKNFATLDAGNSSTFATWQAQGYDAHSVFNNPKWKTDTLLRPNQNTMNGSGTPIAAVSSDFEDEERHATNPDLGADEFSLPSADAGVTAFVGPMAVFPEGVNPVQVRLKNYGTSNLTGVTVNWSVNGITQTPYAWTGVVNYDSSSSPVTIGNFDFRGGRIYNLQFWTTAPNGATDPIAANDTLSQQNVVAALNGIYTVGGTNPDFLNLSAAATGLRLGGITGPTTLSIRSGTYNEPVLLKEIAGASASSRITFQSEAGDSTRVLITQATTTGAMATFTLDSTDYVTLRGLTIQQTGGFLTSALRFKNGAHNNIVENCLLRANANNTSTKLLVDSTGIDSNLVVRNNRFVWGETHIEIDGTEGNNSLQTGLQITGNRFDTVNTRSIYVNGAQGARVTGNYARNTNNNSPGGMLFTGVTGLTSITGNSIYGRYNVGISVSNSANNSGTDSLLVANNMIALSITTGTIYGINLTSTNSAAIYHNSVATSAAGNSAAFYLSNSSNISVVNNIWQHYGNGYAYNLADFSAPAGLTLDYNNAFTNGASIARTGSSALNYAQWQATGRDAAGTNRRPVYIDSSSNLHQNRSIAQLNNTGTASPVSVDFDGEVRNAATPDVGADEFKPYDFDAALLHFDSPQTPFNAAASTPVSVTLRNLGQQTLTSAQIVYTVNGIPQAPFAFSGSIAYGDSVNNLQIGSYQSVSGRSDTIRIWVTSPNGNADENNANDTLTGVFTPALCGTYTVGGNAPDYANLQDVAAALTKGGVSCPVVFNVRDGEYSGALQFAAIPGASATNTVTIQSESGDSTLVILSTPFDFNSGSYVVRLKGASYITFRKMSFLRRPFSFFNQGFNSGLVLMDSTSGKNISISNCYFKAAGTNMTAARITNAGGAFTFDNNYLDSTLTLTVTTKYVAIRNNRLRFGGIAVTADSVYVQNNVSDSLGTINVTASSSVAARTYVQNNVLKANTFTGQPAIFVGNTGGGMISGNRIEQSAGIGIQVNGATNPTLATPLIISNNFVHSKNTNFGLAISGTNNVYVLHNSVHVTGSTSSTGLYVSGGSNNTVLNNNVSNSGGGIAVTLSNVSAIKDLNNNNYYTTGANLGNYNNTNRATLALWQSATGKEGASKNVTPGFLSTTDLHTSQTALDSAGTIAQYNPGSGYQQIVVADFDGEVRNVVKPDIGADEISLIAIDGGVVVITEPTGAALQPASPTKAVKIRIKNFGAQALTSATVNWTVNGVAQTPYSFSGNVASQDTSAVLSIGTINFATGRSYTVQAWTSSVNGSPDNNPVNDSAIVRNVWPALCGSYTVGGSNPDFVTLRDAVNELKNGGLLCAVTINIRNGLYADSTYVLTALPGSSAANTATIRSESGDSSTVVLQTINALPAGVNSLPMFVFDKAQNITVQGLTLRYATNPGIAPEAFVLFRNNGNRNITLANNVLENRSSQTLGLGISSGTGNGSIDTAIVIRNNWLRKVGGIQFCSDADNSSIFNTLLNMPGMRIEGNRIDSVSGGMGISVKNALGPVVSGNRLPQSVIWVRHSSSPQIIANTVAIGNEFSPGYTINTGIALNNITSTAAAHTLIANNMVSVADLSVANTNVPTGIGANGVDYLDLYFNNILLRHTDNQGYIFWGGGAHVNLKNNIFASTSGNPALSGNTFESSDYNNFYTTGNIAPGVATLNDWTGLTIFDDHSLSVNPFFTSNTDLHVAASELDGAGLAITGISTDVDGELRNDPPDMGADERAALARDAALTLLVAPQQPYTHGLQPVKVLLKNNGSQTLTSAQIAWTIAGVAQPVYNWTGSIAPSATATVTIGNYDFQLRSDNRLRAIVSNPNGGADEFNANDTLTQNNLWAALNGSYTIGGITPTFTDFLQAFEQLQKGGVTGSVSIAARNGTYAGSFYVSNIPGHGVANPITIWGETHNRDSVSITGPHTGFSHEYVGVLMNLSYVTFRNINFDNRTNASSGTVGAVIRAGLDAHHLTFDSCAFKAIRPVGQTNSSEAFNLLSFEYYAGATRNGDSCTITHSRFTGGGKSIRISSISSTIPVNGMRVDSNEFINPYFVAIESSYALGHSRIEGNLITDTTDFADFKAINIANYATNVAIRGNRIAVQGNGTGIDISNSTTLPTTLENRIVNNFVQIGTTAPAIGIKATGKWLRILHNTVRMTSSSPAAVAAQLTPDANTGGIVAQNNIFVNSGGGYAIRVLQTSFASALTSNYNDLFTTGAQLGSWMNTDAATLAAWRALSGRDGNSISADPNFRTNNDLHSRATALNGSAVPIIGIEATDIDGDPRSLTAPDLGADEFSPPNLTVTRLLAPVDGCQTTATETVQIRVKNDGPTAQAEQPVAYRINGGTIVRDTLRTALAPGAEVDFTFPGTVDLSAIGTYAFEAWTDIPGDSLPQNDTLRLTIHHTRVVSSYPYFEGFEGNDGGWFAQGQNSSWAWGVIASPNIDSAYGGTKGWKTALAGQYRNNERSYLESPCFDLTQFGSAQPKIWFMHAYQIEPINDSNWVEWSDNGGQSWNRLGTSGGGEHWYNAGTAWSGDHKDWELAGFDIPMSAIGNRNAVRFRIAFATNGSDIRDGVGIDNIFIDTLLPITQGNIVFGGRARSAGLGTIDILSQSSERMVQIGDNGNTLGLVTVQAQLGTTPVVHNGTTYMGRHWVITPQTQPTTPVLVRLYFTQAEFDTLRAHDPAITSVNSLAIYKYSGSNSDLDLANNGGSGQYIGVPDVQFVPYGNGYYAEFMASGFSEFWLTKSNAGPVIDAALTALVSPAQQSCYGATETVSFTLKNNGNATLDFAVTPVTINAAVTGPNAQTFAPLVVNSGTLAAGASQTVTVSTSYNMSAVGTYGFSASASISGDINPGNNSIATVQRTVEALIAGTVSGNVAGYCGTGGTPTMTVSGGPYTSIQWQEGSSASGPWTNVGTNASTYTPATVITASTWYRAIVQCGAQSATTAPTSVLLAAPEVISTTPVTTCGNSVISVTATASNGASISWYDAPVGGNLLGTGTHLVQTISATTTYYAEASEGSCRSARVAVVATVQAATAVTTEPTDVMACTSMPATFTVAATGSGTLSYQWRKVGSPIPGANAATYTIGSITSGDYGSYDVIVTGDCGSDTSAAVTLQICTAVSTTDLTINHAALSPVPAHNHATLRVTAARATRIEWSIIDNKGLVVRRFSQRVMAGDNTLALSLADLSAGTYLLSGTTDKGKITVIRFVKL